ncbi:MAG TPA: hypothetical protein VK726_03975 [Acetobacteraceae bacterium]|jgi:hypothetical protein|nr:hypothetical protein [Acetobacteraceae bacterium]
MRIPGVVGLCWLLLSCSGNGQRPTVMLASAPGVTSVYPYSGTVSGAPWPGTATTRSVADLTPVQDGTYAGEAVPLSTDGGLCWQTRDVDNFQVHGGNVQYGGFNGHIDANNSVQMVYGTKRLIGQFARDVFQGQLITTGAQQDGGCIFALTLRREGV